MSFVSMCFAADGTLSYDEYELLLNIVESDGFSYDTCVNLVRHCLNNDSDEIDEMIIMAPQYIRSEIANLCVSIAAIDEIITADEKTMCLKYFLVACIK